MKTVKGLEGRMCKEWLRFAHPKEGSGGAGAELCSLGAATGPEGTAQSWDRGGSGWA